jgi:uncharacterized protein with NRDE domain
MYKSFSDYLDEAFVWNKDDTQDVKDLYKIGGAFGLFVGTYQAGILLAIANVKKQVVKDGLKKLGKGILLRGIKFSLLVGTIGTLVLAIEKIFTTEEDLKHKMKWAEEKEDKDYYKGQLESIEKKKDMKKKMLALEISRARAKYDTLTPEEKKDLTERAEKELAKK